MLVGSWSITMGVKGSGTYACDGSSYGVVSVVAVLAKCGQSAG